MLRVREDLTPQSLLPKIRRLWELSARKVSSLEKTYSPAQGAPVFTVQGRYTARGWTEWTQGFQYGSAILQFDATGERPFLELGRAMTVKVMASHLTHFGVHDHGFNNVSTYGNLWRLMREGRIDDHPWERNFYELALKVSGAVQARRWTKIRDGGGGGGFIYSFNGPHSLFVDTIRSLRALAISHRLGHAILAENDEPISLLERLIQHARTTARFNVYYGEGRDAFDVPGRVAHEIIFNVNDGSYRCPSTQQGYSPFSTWTRGLAWVMLGFAELLEFLTAIEVKAGEPELSRAARITCDFYLKSAAAADGVPYWDTGAPGLRHLDLEISADPFNDHEPVDSSAAAIAAQALLRFGRYLGEEAGKRFEQAGLTILNSLLAPPYLSEDSAHQGLILHSVYHRPNGWDYVPEGRKVPCGESSMWGDYHARELALYVQRLATGEPYLTFFGPK